MSQQVPAQSGHARTCTAWRAPALSRHARACRMREDMPESMPEDMAGVPERMSEDVPGECRRTLQTGGSPKGSCLGEVHVMLFDVVFCRFSMSLDVRLGWGWGGSISTGTWFDVMFLSCEKLMFIGKHVSCYGSFMLNGCPGGGLWISFFFGDDFGSRLSGCSCFFLRFVASCCFA